MKRVIGFFAIGAMYYLSPVLNSGNYYSDIA